MPPVPGADRPVWSAAILAELGFHEAGKLLRRGAAGPDAERRAGELVDRMRTAFDDAEVSGREPLEGTVALPDPDDEHGVAAAVIARAAAIVTANLKDIPAARLPADLQVLGPAQFAASTVDVDPVAAVRAVSGIAGPSPAGAGRTGGWARSWTCWRAATP